MKYLNTISKGFGLEAISAYTRVLTERIYHQMHIHIKHKKYTKNNKQKYTNNMSWGRLEIELDVK